MVVPALQVVALKYSTLPLFLSATYTKPFTASTARALGAEAERRLTVATQVAAEAETLYTATVPLPFPT